jgi:hypothetical protein
LIAGAWASADVADASATMIATLTGVIPSALSVFDLHIGFSFSCASARPLPLLLRMRTLPQWVVMEQKKCDYMLVRTPDFQGIEAIRDFPANIGYI